MNKPHDNHHGKKTFEYEFESKKVVLEVDRLSNKSEKSVLCRFGDTTVLTTLILGEVRKEPFPFVPLTITVEERAYAVGRIPNVFNKREGKGTYVSIKAARVIDRSLRNFFPKEVYQEVQITNLILSVDHSCSSLLASLWGSFLVCFLAPELPFFHHCLGMVIVGEKEGQLSCGLSWEELAASPLELVVAGSETRINMLELGAAEIEEGKLEKALVFAQQKIRPLICFFQRIAKSLGVEKTPPVPSPAGEISAEEKKLKEAMGSYLNQAREEKLPWLTKEKNLKKFKKDLFSAQEEELEPIPRWKLESLWNSVLKEKITSLLSEKGTRLDGRRWDEIRRINVEMNPLPNSIVHGSALFERGITQVMSVVTIGKSSEKQLIDSVMLPSSFHKHFIHHYNFSQIATGELSLSRSLTRREIGHGDLVEKTLSYLLPKPEEFPYTLRVVSEVLTSNASSSQAAISASSLALLSAGIPLTRPAAGVSLGLFGEHLLVDMIALEDQLGEMDFKIGGTEKGVCSIQLDVKNEGLDLDFIRRCLREAKKARLSVLRTMAEQTVVIPPQSPNLIKWRRFYVGPEKMGLAIGQGGKVINELTRRTGASFDVQSSGHLLIYHSSEEQLNKICEEIERIISFRKKPF